MKTVSCLLFLAIGQVIGESGLDEFKMFELIGEMKDLYADDAMITEGFTGEKKRFQNCLQTIHETYKGHVENEFLDVIETTLLRYYEEYNALVLTYLEVLEAKAKNGKSLETMKSIVEKIEFKDSKVHCVIGLLSVFKRPINDKLRDYVFFDDLPAPNDLAELKTLVWRHYDERLAGLSMQINVDRFYVGKLLTKRLHINNFASRICNTVPAPWIRADKWVWRRLKRSPIITRDIYHVTQLLDWKDLICKGDKTGEEILTYDYEYLVEKPMSDRLKVLSFATNKSSPISSPTTEINQHPETIEKLRSIKERTMTDETDVQPAECDLNASETTREEESLRTLFDNEHEEHKNVERFHHRVAARMDKYVSKVLFSMILKIIATALRTYGSVLDGENSNLDKHRLTEYEQLAGVLSVFKILFESYFNSRPVTLCAETLRDMNNILDYSINAFATYEVHRDDSRVARIERHLRDKRFLSHFGDDRRRGTIGVRELMEETRRINEYINELVEIKSGN